MENALQVVGGKLAVKGGTTILAFDLSGSMNDCVFGETTKCKLVANTLPAAFRDLQRNGVERLGLIFFSSTAETWPIPGVLCTTAAAECNPPTEADFRAWAPRGGNTALVDALLCAIQMAYKQTNRPRRVVVMTDGVENASISWRPFNREKTKKLFAQAAADGILVSLSGFTRGAEKEALEKLAQELGIRCQIHQHDDSAQSVADSIVHTGHSIVDLGSIC